MVNNRHFKALFWMRLSQLVWFSGALAFATLSVLHISFEDAWGLPHWGAAKYGLNIFLSTAWLSFGIWKTKDIREFKRSIEER